MCFLRFGQLLYTHTKEPLIGMSSLCVTRKTQNNRVDDKIDTHKIYVFKNAT